MTSEWNVGFVKGHLTSKADCQAEDSPKKRTNEFVFTSVRHVFVRFLGESSARTKTFRDYLTFKIMSFLQKMSKLVARFRNKICFSQNNVLYFTRNFYCFYYELLCMIVIFNTNRNSIPSKAPSRWYIKEDGRFV